MSKMTKACFIFTASCLAASLAYSQTSLDANIPYTLTVTAEELQTIGKALEVMPYREAAPLISKLSQQVAQQNQSRQKAQEQKKALPPAPSAPRAE